ncbi:hypothetical protein ACPH3O_003435, partial [Cronobacter sakazakii]
IQQCRCYDAVILCYAQRVLFRMYFINALRDMSFCRLNVSKVLIRHEGTVSSGYAVAQLIMHSHICLNSGVLPAGITDLRSR